jgi:hypothetical protein
MMSRIKLTQDIRFGRFRDVDLSHFINALKLHRLEGLFYKKKTKYSLLVQEICPCIPQVSKYECDNLFRTKT